MHEPEWIITTYDSSKRRNTLFKDLFGQRENIDSMLLLFDYNSYYINLDGSGRYFIINGGRRIQPTALALLEKPTLLYARRHTRTMSVTGEEEPTDTTTYLLGAEGMLQGHKQELFLQISANGRHWIWKDKR